MYLPLLNRFPVLKDISDEIGGVNNQCHTFISYNNINPHLEDLKYFPKDQFYDITKVYMSNRLIPSARKDKGFPCNREQKLIDIVSGIIASNLLSVISKKNILKI